MIIFWNSSVLAFQHDLEEQRNLDECMQSGYWLNIWLLNQQIIYPVSK
jgi:hypothetical protein